MSVGYFLYQQHGQGPALVWRCWYKSTFIIYFQTKYKILIRVFSRSRSETSSSSSLFESRRRMRSTRPGWGCPTLSQANQTDFYVEVFFFPSKQNFPFYFSCSFWFWGLAVHPDHQDSEKVLDKSLLINDAKLVPVSLPVCLLACCEGAATTSSGEKC